MLTGMRSRFLLFFLLIFSVAACLPVHAQVNGVPPSVTSIGFGGSTIPRGVQPSVTSVKPNGYGGSAPFWGACCYNFFLPADPNPPRVSERHRRHHENDRPYVGVLVQEYDPIVVPYALETGPDSSDDDSPDNYSDDADEAHADYVHAPATRNPDAVARRAVRTDSELNVDASAKPIPGEQAPGEETPGEPTSADRTSGGSAEPAAAQPATVLVFKDGHQSDVLNYAIVGDTLFDFAAGRLRKILLADLDLPATRKANDDRGVDFQVPAGATR